VVVRDTEGVDRTCFLSGHRAVIGDKVRFLIAKGTGGKLTDVLPRERYLERKDFKGRIRIVASHLGGLCAVASAKSPPYRPGLLDRYQMAAAIAGVDFAVVLTKVDLGVTDEVEADLAWRASLGVPVYRVDARQGEGVQAVAAFLAEQEADGPWAFVGHSGVGKTSLIAHLLPDQDVGPIGEISEFWDQGKHTTTGSRIFSLGDEVEIADSPGIRTFLPSGLEPSTVRDVFPGIGHLGCHYRDCLHREGEEGCVAEEQVEAELLTRYRRVLNEVIGHDERERPWVVHQHPSDEPETP